MDMTSTSLWRWRLAGVFCDGDHKNRRRDAGATKNLSLW
jgi:hypothetical protein